VKEKVKVSAPGKIILSGEHAVVYGYPDLLAAVNRRLTISLGKTKNKQGIILPESTALVNYALKKLRPIFKEANQQGVRVEINSQIPIGRGMGSSAALAVALSGAAFQLGGHTWNLEEVNQSAYEIEKKQHGKPSGGDNTISTYGGFLWFRKEAEGVKLFHHLKPKRLLKILLIDTGKPKENTGQMISLVKDFLSKCPRKAKDTFQNIEEVTRCFLKFLIAEKNYSLRDLFKKNERLLETLGVVSDRTKNIIRKIEKLGGGAKISGAGGQKAGSGIILAYHSQLSAIRQFAQKEDLPIFEVKLGEEGVRVEKKKNSEKRNNSN